MRLAYSKGEIQGVVYDYFTHVGSRALKHCMINQLTQLKILPPLKKISETRIAGLGRTGLGTRLARANGAVSQFPAQSAV